MKGEKSGARTGLLLCRGNCRCGGFRARDNLGAVAVIVVLLCLSFVGEARGSSATLTWDTWGGSATWWDSAGKKLKAAVKVANKHPINQRVRGWVLTGVSSGVAARLGKVAYYGLVVGGLGLSVGLEQAVLNWAGQHWTIENGVPKTQGVAPNTYQCVARCGQMSFVSGGVPHYVYLYRGSATWPGVLERILAEHGGSYSSMGQTSMRVTLGAQGWSDAYWATGAAWSIEYKEEGAVSKIVVGLTPYSANLSYVELLPTSEAEVVSAEAVATQLEEDLEANLPLAVHVAELAGKEPLLGRWLDDVEGTVTPEAVVEEVETVRVAVLDGADAAQVAELLAQDDGAVAIPPKEATVDVEYHPSEWIGPVRDGVAAALAQMLGPEPDLPGAIGQVEEPEEPDLPDPIEESEALKTILEQHMDNLSTLPLVSWLAEVEVDIGAQDSMLMLPSPFGVITVDFAPYEGYLEVLGNLMLTFCGLYWTVWLFMGRGDA